MVRSPAPPRLAYVAWIAVCLIWGTTTWRSSSRWRPRQAALGALMLGIGNGAVVWAERWIPSGIAAVGVAALPFWMAGTEAAAGGDRLRGRVVVGFFTGFSGIGVLIWPSLFAADVSGPRFGLGVLLVQAACVGWAVGRNQEPNPAADRVRRGTPSNR